MLRFSLKLALIVIAHVTISSQSRASSQSRPSIFAYSNYTVIDLTKSSDIKSEDRLESKNLKEYSLEDNNLTEDEKMARIQDQVHTMEKHCERCEKPLNTKLFPASMTLEKIMGVSDYPYKTEIVNSYNFYIKQCPSEKHCTSHRSCYSKSNLYRRYKEYFHNYDKRRCFGCKSAVPEEYILENALQCLYKSSKCHEFAYIYKALKKYDGGDIRTCLGHTAAPVANAQKIRSSIDKCQFKGKNSMLASLDFFLLNENSEDKAAILGSFMRNSMGDSILNDELSLENIIDNCKSNDEIIQCLMAAVDNISEEHVLKKRIFYIDLLNACHWYFNKTEILQMITRCMLSKQYFLLSYIKQVPSEAWEDRYRSLQRAEKLPSSLKILSILENNIHNTSDNILLSGCIDEKAKAIASYIIAFPIVFMPSDEVYTFLYLKRLCKMKSKTKTSFRYKKDYILFCESLITHLQKNMLVYQIFPWFNPLENGIMTLKICMFYSKKYNYKLHNSTYLAQIFEQLDLASRSKPENAIIIEKHLSLDERREILYLRALNSNFRFASDAEEPMDMLDLETQKFLARNFIDSGKLLMREGLQIVPQICKTLYNEDQYKRFLHDMCLSTEISRCELNFNVVKDLREECKNYLRYETGFLPLNLNFYRLLKCDKWEDNEVMMWCEKNNFVDWLRCLPSPWFRNNMYKIKIEYTFVKRHFNRILKYVLDKSADNIYAEAELVAKCWFAAVYSEDFIRDPNLEIFTALAAAKNGYIHANIYYLLKRKGPRQILANEVMDNICRKKYNDCADKYKVIELQKKYVSFIKKWEETDVIFSTVSRDFNVVIQDFVEKLEEIKTTEVHTLFNDFIKHSNALKNIKESHAVFYRMMAESLDFIPQAAIALYNP
ncbi:hypothetical protein ENBRE01_1977 [Enteropsectra breve]|nr:hypothetical protein ENBRE01_1977 [Enteropsectra breve]